MIATSLYTSVLESLESLNVNYVFHAMKSDKLFFDSIRYRYDIRVFFSIVYDTIRYEGFKKDLLLKEFSANFRQIFRIFGDFFEFSDLLLLLRTLVHGFSEFSGNFRRIFDEKDKKMTGFENIEILDMGGSIRYTLRYTEKSDISAFDKFSIR